MKRNFIVLSFFLIFILVVTLGCSPKPEIQNLKESQFLIGTIVTLNLYHEDMALLEQTLSDITNKIQSLESIFSRRLDSAELYQLNHSNRSTISVSADLYYLLEKSITYSTLSDGYFDITALPIIDLWGIDTDTPRVPLASDLKSALERVDISNIDLIDNKQVTYKNYHSQIDLGGIAKGYITDEIVKILDKNNIPFAIIDLGGNLYVHGKKNNTIPWTLGIRDPKGDISDILGTLELSDASLVTSGAYERFFESDGTIYHHILDPNTGYPIENDLLSASIISKSSIDCDALSTSVFALGLVDGMALIESIDDTETVIVTKERKVYVSSGLKNNFELLSKDYELIE